MLIYKSFVPRTADKDKKITNTEVITCNIFGVERNFYIRSQLHIYFPAIILSTFR